MSPEPTQHAESERARLEAAMPIGDYYECLACDDGWDFVGEPPFYCLHCGAQIDGPGDAQ